MLNRLNIYKVEYTQLNIDKVTWNVEYSEILTKLHEMLNIYKVKGNVKYIQDYKVKYIQGYREC